MSHRLSIRILDEDKNWDADWTILSSLTDEEAQIVKESAITREVTAALWRKQIDGAKEHGHAMQLGDDVDALRNALDETIDLAQYLMKELGERDSG